MPLVGHHDCHDVSVVVPEPGSHRRAEGESLVRAEFLGREAIVYDSGGDVPEPVVGGEIRRDLGRTGNEVPGAACAVIGALEPQRLGVFGDEIAHPAVYLMASRNDRPGMGQPSPMDAVDHPDISRRAL